MKSYTKAKYIKYIKSQGALAVLFESGVEYLFSLPPINI